MQNLGTKQETFFSKEDEYIYNESISKRSKPNEGSCKNEVLPYFGCTIDQASVKDNTIEQVIPIPLTPTGIQYQQPSSTLMGFFDQRDNLQHNILCSCPNEMNNTPIFKARLQDLTPLICSKLEMAHTLTNCALAESLLNEIYCNKDHNLTMLQSSVRRRLYDCINVLTSIGLINKDGRNLTWAGDGFKVRTPNSGPGLKQLIKSTIEDKELVLHEKTESLREMRQRIFMYNKLASRNKHSLYRAKSLLTLPLLLIRISNSNNIECRLSRNHMTAQYTFDGPFTIVQDAELLRSLDFSFDSVTPQRNSFSAFQYLPEMLCANPLPFVQAADSHVLHTKLPSEPL
ncbi:hypothetical protein LOD99_13368 [Oopsacas minuta]|uniref:Uncharacterized protein n=1 Tax=Oopsacas minuta TaxID=111878 RepID=A0AAV7KL38_9METZ|nr:hypothetical protein LOD99_13368 [Oopsacas minuta]